jgi:hypothetical protein
MMQRFIHRRQTRSILMVIIAVTLCWMTGGIVVQHLTERALILTVSWGNLIWLVAGGLLVGLALVPALAERVLARGEERGTFSTRHLLLLAGGILGLSLGGMLLLPLLPAALIWPWQASVVLGLLASGLLFGLLRHDATCVRLPSWGSEAQMGGGLLAAGVLSLALWALASSPVWTLLAAWLAAVVLVTSWLWSIHILVRAGSPQ